jgi:hypothetical protein
MRMRIWDPGIFLALDPWSGMEKIRIQDKHPGSAILIFYIWSVVLFKEPERWELMRREWNTWAPLFLFNRQVFEDQSISLSMGFLNRKLIPMRSDSWVLADSAVLISPLLIFQCGGSGLFIPNPDTDFLPSRIPDPGVKKAPNPGSGSATLLYFMPKPRSFSTLLFTRECSTFWSGFECSVFNRNALLRIR